MSPYEKVFGIKPNLSNLRIFGCKAYRRRPQIPKLDKLEPRAEVGYFVVVGVQASNIFKIWHPQLRSIVVSRDVEFDENLFFNSDQPIKLLRSAAQNEQDTVLPSVSSGNSSLIPYEDIIQRQYRAIFENQRRIQNLDLNTTQQEFRQNKSQRSITADRSGSDSRDETIQRSDAEKMDWMPTYISPPAEFLSWLFEGALSRCVSTALNIDADSASTCVLNQDVDTIYDCDPPSSKSELVDAQHTPSTRKRLPWSVEEEHLLVKLREEHNLSWSEVTKRFAQKFPGRRKGSLQVYWSTKLKKKRSCQLNSN